LKIKLAMKDFLKTHFDKLLLSALFLTGLGTFMHFARELAFYSTQNNVNHLSGLVNWLENTVGQILAALLTLMVGRSLTASAVSSQTGSSASTGTSDEEPTPPVPPKT
jgi:hypothetical protein